VHCLYDISTSCTIIISHDREFGGYGKVGVVRTKKQRRGARWIGKTYSFLSLLLEMYKDDRADCEGRCREEGEFGSAGHLERFSCSQSFDSTEEYVWACTVGVIKYCQCYDRDCIIVVLDVTSYDIKKVPLSMMSNAKRRMPCAAGELKASFDLDVTDLYDHTFFNCTTTPACEFLSCDSCQSIPFPYSQPRNRTVLNRRTAKMVCRTCNHT
jgi:hypothetical protein